MKLSLFAAQEVPAAIVTFVSLLVFVQTGTSPALSTLYSALLALPWVAKFWLGERVRRRRHYRVHLLLSEVLLVGLLFMASAVMNPSSILFSFLGVGNDFTIFVVLLLLSMVTAWHETIANAHYHYTIRPIVRRFYDAPRLFVSQSMIVFTYGLLIIMVSSLEVLYRSIYVSWSIAFRVAAGVILLALLWHVVKGLVERGSAEVDGTAKSAHLSLHADASKSVVHNRSFLRGVVFMTLMLLPQSFMFYTRVLYLLAPVEEGGLACSLQEVGFAHGVAGAIAFSIGLLASHKLVVRSRERAKRNTLVHPSPFRRSVSFAPSVNVLRSSPSSFLLSCLPLLLSPLVYLLMTVWPPQMLWQLSLCTFTAQLMFGFGLHRMLYMLHLPAINGLRLPVVAAAMILPMAFSGWLVLQLGYQQFFLIDSLTALLPFVFLLFYRTARHSPKE